MKTILITGSNGLVGQHLVYLLKQDPSYRVIATGRGVNRLYDQQGYTYIATDLLDAVAAEQLVLDTRPDIIIHAAALSLPDYCEQHMVDCWNTNVTATRFLIDAAKKTNSFFLLLSTDFVFDGLNGPYAEQNTPNPMNYYGSSKVAAEKAVQESHLRWAIARTILVYGLADSHSRKTIVTLVKEGLETGKMLQLVNDQFRMPTLVHDLAIGCKSICDGLHTGIYHLSGQEWFTPFEMGRAIAEHLQLDPHLIISSDRTQFKEIAQRPPKTGFILDKAQKELHYQPRTLQQGLALIFPG
jgi:dTDP-4-dehydrorhamnose reductase